MSRRTAKPDALSGFAFVEMPNDEEAAKAIAGLDGKAIGRTHLKVNEARPKDASPPPRTNNSAETGMVEEAGRRLLPTKIIVSPQDSRANPAGNSRTFMRGPSGYR